MKKLIAILLSVCLMLGMSSCSKEDKHTEPTAATQAEESTEPQNTETESTTEEPLETKEPTEESSETEEMTEELPSDPCLRMYQELINDYKTILQFRQSDSFEQDWNEGNGIPEVSETLQKSLSRMGELGYEWSNMIVELPANEIGEAAFGYLLHDINGDGIPELFWVQNDHSIVAIFTYYDNGVNLLRACWGRFHCHIAQNNTLYCWGSSGVADNFCSSYALDNGELIETYRFYSEGDGHTIRYYETSASTKMEISSERYRELSTAFAYENSPMWCSLPVQFLSTKVTDAATAEVPQENSLPYLQRIDRADQSIWDGPGYDYGFVGVVELAGTYTITAQVRDYEGNLWGRLKSGAGWIDLSEIAYEKSSPPILSANYADQTLLHSGNFHHCTADNSPYTVQIAFRTYQTLNDVSFFCPTMVGEDEAAEELFYIAQWTPDKPFVADVAFPGDMTTYCISFTDSNGVSRTYAVSLSGRNGSVVLYEYG